METEPNQQKSFPRLFRAMRPKQIPRTDPSESTLKKWSMVRLASELGFIIALPLVVLALAGKWLDLRIHTFPWFTLAGIILAITTTTLWLTKRLKSFIK